MIAEIIFGALAITFCVAWSLFGAYGVITWRTRNRSLGTLHTAGLAPCLDCGCWYELNDQRRCWLCAEISRAAYVFHVQMATELKAQHPDWPIFIPEPEDHVMPYDDMRDHDDHDHEDLVDGAGRVIKRMCIPEVRY